ncbi:NYN domain-containing protein [Cellulomonas sp. PhB150]|uniref:NYN domain-containing protein n=1 Tax=Cellulomonas sp. PhB150 TaxID=2485188 RepID=UPI001315238F|nr:NYN domain-containing protein [Cellulomonas sp. PhB150]
MTNSSTTGSEPARRLRSALFVDFDNVYLGLLRIDPVAAEQFATEPGQWLDRLEAGVDADGPFQRRFLVRLCYLNPAAFSQFRPNFLRAGFRVIDCPSLTQQGKSSADIYLVLDAVDAISGVTHYDEFVIASADADFTPLALRCRAADRRVSIITAGPVAGAYRAVADTVVSADELAELVLPERTTAPVGTGVGTVGTAGQPEVEAAPEPKSRARAPKAAATGTAPAEKPATTARKAKTPKAVAPPVSKARAVVVQRVTTSVRPLHASTVAQLAQNADEELGSTNWAGAGSFLAWLARDVPEVASATKPSPGWVWDPARFGEADLPQPGGQVNSAAISRQVVAVTDTPGLTTSQYGTLLRALADDLAKEPFERVATSRRVREACQAAGAPVGRASVNVVLGGIVFAGLDLAKAPSAQECARAWADNVIGLCRGARMELSATDVAAIRSWVGGGLLDA